MAAAPSGEHPAWAFWDFGEACQYATHLATGEHLQLWGDGAAPVFAGAGPWREVAVFDGQAFALALAGTDDTRAIAALDPHLSMSIAWQDRDGRWAEIVRFAAPGRADTRGDVARSQHEAKVLSLPVEPARGGDPLALGPKPFKAEYYWFDMGFRAGEGAVPVRCWVSAPWLLAFLFGAAGGRKPKRREQALDAYLQGAGFGHRFRESSLSARRGIGALGPASSSSALVSDGAQTACVSMSGVILILARMVLDKRLRLAPGTGAGPAPDGEARYIDEAAPRVVLNAIVGFVVRGRKLRLLSIPGLTVVIEDGVVDEEILARSQEEGRVRKNSRTEGLS